MRSHPEKGSTQEFCESTLSLASNWALPSPTQISLRSKERSFFRCCLPVASYWLIFAPPILKRPWISYLVSQYSFELIMYHEMDLASSLMILHEVFVFLVAFDNTRICYCKFCRGVMGVTACLIELPCTFDVTRPCASLRMVLLCRDSSIDLMPMMFCLVISLLWGLFCTATISALEYGSSRLLHSAVIL